MNDEERREQEEFAAAGAILDQAHAEAVEALRAQGTDGQFILFVPAVDEDGERGVRMLAGGRGDGASESWEPGGDVPRPGEDEVVDFVMLSFGALFQLVKDAGLVEWPDPSDDEDDDGSS